VLETKGLSKQFGGIVATDDVSLSVEKGARHALIGRTAPARPRSSIC
jgi:ABC-type branched-subunit amino acid transport system ATPase component